MLLKNFVGGQWLAPRGEGQPLFDPVSGERLVSVSAEGVDVAAALAYARETGGAGLAGLNFAQRGEMLGRIADVLTAHRTEYFELSRRNSGATEGDASFDVDGAIFTIKTYAKLARSLGEGNGFVEGGEIPLAKGGVFAARHFLLPVGGVAVFINAFNFPAWGLWEKAAPALLAGVPVLAKPATPTAWLTQRMVEDVVAADILPPGALSILCGSPRDLLDHVTGNDVVSFTGSAGTAARLRTHPNMVARSVRLNVEADSVNSAILGPDAAPGSAEFELMVKEIAREMTIKSGQKCTAIRRAFAPRAVARDLAAAVAARLAQVTVGDPANPEVRMGPLVSTAQQQAAAEGLALLQEDAVVAWGGGQDFAPVAANPGAGAFVQPTLLYCDQPATARRVHEVEVFGPVATVLPYDSEAELVALVRRGQGSLVASVYSGDAAFLQRFVPAIADLHGRVMVVDASVGSQHTGHGNVMPTCLHGGPGRAGGGEELGGLRALGLYLRRVVVQGPPAHLAVLAASKADAALLSA